MLTAEIKVNGRLVSAVSIRNIAGANGPKLEGVADYEVLLLNPKGLFINKAPVEIKQWDRSRPAHELVHAAIEAIMEASK